MTQRPGRRVNMERSVRLGGRLDGHLVQGHVDGVAPVLAVRKQGDDRRLRVGLVPEIARFVAVKGSITLQGVSLTVTTVDREGFEVALVPVHAGVDEPRRGAPRRPAQRRGGSPGALS